MLPHYHCLKGHPRPAGYRGLFLRDSEGLVYNPFVSTSAINMELDGLMICNV